LTHPLNTPTLALVHYSSIDHIRERENRMKAHVMLRTMSTLVALTIGALGFAGEPPTPRASAAPTIEGTYQLVSRKLPDGTMQRPPEIMGLLTYTKSHRNFNVVWKDANNKFFSYSLVSTYTLTPTEYRETIIFSILNDQIGGQDIVYDLSGKTQRVPVTIDGGRLQFKLPFDPPSVVFEGDRMTATAEGRFVDVWQKVP
jgi:hypothetical protein